MTSTMHGSLTVTDFNNSGSDCFFGSDSGYSDISEDAQVIVKAPDGNVIGSGQLGSPVSGSSGGMICSFPLKVTGLPGESRYGVEVSHRGTVWFTPAEIEHANLSLG